MLSSAPVKIKRTKKKTQGNQGAKIFIRIHNKKWHKDIVSIEEQLDFIREIIEEECALNKLGLKFIGFLTHGKLAEPIVAAEYSMKKSVDFEAIRKVFQDRDINNRLQIYILLD